MVASSIWQSILFIGLTFLSVNAQAASGGAVRKVEDKVDFLRNLQTECDCADYTDNTCFGYGYNGGGSSALPSNFEVCADVCCNCRCSAVTVELCVACLDADACYPFLENCARECCILQESKPNKKKWGWGGGKKKKGYKGGKYSSKYKYGKKGGKGGKGKKGKYKKGGKGKW